MAKSENFKFNGGAATYFGTQLLAIIVTVCTLGFLYPYAVVLKQRWKAKHTYINGNQLKFNGYATGLFGNWIKWWILTIITFGIYSFWVMPKLNKWIVEHTDFQNSQLKVIDLNVQLQSAPQTTSMTYTV